MKVDLQSLDAAELDRFVKKRQAHTIVCGTREIIWKWTLGTRSDGLLLSPLRMVVLYCIKGVRPRPPDLEATKMTLSSEIVFYTSMKGRSYNK